MARTRSLIGGGKGSGSPKKIGWALVTERLTAAERSARTKKGWLKRQRARQVTKGRIEIARASTAYATMTTAAGYTAHPGLGNLNVSTRKRAHDIGAKQGQAAHDAFVDYVIQNQKPGQSGASLANLVRKAVAAANNASGPSTRTGSNAPTPPPVAPPPVVTITPQAVAPSPSVPIQVPTPPAPAATAPTAPSPGTFKPHPKMSTLPSPSTVKRAQTIGQTQGQAAHDAFVNYYDQNYPAAGLSGAALANFGRKAVAAANAAAAPGPSAGPPASPSLPAGAVMPGGAITGRRFTYTVQPGFALVKKRQGQFTYDVYDTSTGAVVSTGSLGLLPTRFVQVTPTPSPATTPSPVAPGSGFGPGTPPIGGYVAPPTPPATTPSSGSIPMLPSAPYMAQVGYADLTRPSLTLVPPTVGQYAGRRLAYDYLSAGGGDLGDKAANDLWAMSNRPPGSSQLKQAAFAALDSEFQQALSAQEYGELSDLLDTISPYGSTPGDYSDPALAALHSMRVYLDQGGTWAGAKDEARQGAEYFARSQIAALRSSLNEIASSTSGVEAAEAAKALAAFDDMVASRYFPRTLAHAYGYAALRHHATGRADFADAAANDAYAVWVNRVNEDWSKITARVAISQVGQANGHADVTYMRSAPLSPPGLTWTAPAGSPQAAPSSTPTGTSTNASGYVVPVASFGANPPQYRAPESGPLGVVGVYLNTGGVDNGYPQSGSAERDVAWRTMLSGFSTWGQDDADAAFEFVEGLGDVAGDGDRSDVVLAALYGYHREFERSGDAAKARGQALDFAGMVAEHQIGEMVQNLVEIRSSATDPGATDAGNAITAISFLMSGLPSSANDEEAAAHLLAHAAAYTALRDQALGNYGSNRLPDSITIASDTMDEWDLLPDSTYQALRSGGYGTDRTTFKPAPPPVVQGVPNTPVVVPQPTITMGHRSSNHAPNWVEPVDISQGGPDAVGNYFKTVWGIHGGPPDPGSPEASSRQAALDEVDTIYASMAPAYRTDVDLLNALGPSDLMLAAKATYVANLMSSSDTSQARIAALTNATKFAKTNLVQLTGDVSKLGMPKLDAEFSKSKQDLGYIGAEVYAEAALAHAARYPQDEDGAMLAAQQAVADYLSLAKSWNTPTSKRQAQINAHNAAFDPKNAGTFSGDWADHQAMWDAKVATRARTAGIASATQGTVQPSAPSGPPAPPANPNQTHMTPQQIAAQASNQAQVQQAIAARQAAAAAKAAKPKKTAAPKPVAAPTQAGPPVLRAVPSFDSTPAQPGKNTMGWSEAESRVNNSDFSYYPSGDLAMSGQVGWEIRNIVRGYLTYNPGILTDDGSRNPSQATKDRIGKAIGQGVQAAYDFEKANPGKPDKAAEVFQAAYTAETMRQFAEVIDGVDLSVGMPDWSSPYSGGGTGMDPATLRVSNPRTVDIVPSHDRSHPPMANITGIARIDEFLEQRGLSASSDTNFVAAQQFINALKTAVKAGGHGDRSFENYVGKMSDPLDRMGYASKKHQAMSFELRLAGYAAVVKEQSQGKPLTKGRAHEVMLAAMEDHAEKVIQAEGMDAALAGDQTYKDLRDNGGPLAAWTYGETGDTRWLTGVLSLYEGRQKYGPSGKPLNKAAASRHQAIFAARTGQSIAPAPSLGTVTGAPTTGGPAPWATLAVPDHSIVPPLRPDSGLTVGQKKVLDNALNGVTDPAMYASVHNAVVKSLQEYNASLAGATPTAGQTRQANADAIGDAQSAATRAARGATTNPDGSINAPPGSQAIAPGTAGALGADSAPKQPRTGHHNPVIGARRTSDIMDVPVLADPSKDHPAYHIDRPLDVLEDLDKLGVIDAMLKKNMNNTTVTPVTKRDDDGSVFNHLLAAINIVQGFNAEPHVVSEAEIDNYARRGEQKWYRGNGATAPNRRAKNNGPGQVRHPNDQFRDGVYWPGGAGMQCYGYGLYAGQFQTAQSYASGATNGRILKMTIKKGARTTDQYTVTRLKSKLASAMSSDPKWSQPQYAPLRQALTNSASEADGYVAALYGYDGYTTTAGTFVIENRGAVRVADKDVTRA